MARQKFYFANFIPDPAVTRSEYRLKAIIAEFEAEYRKNCLRVGKDGLTTEENTRQIQSKITGLGERL